mmetsp:Transcript_82894/g.221504  ORF Transcript_82894/g.221504 Transcript_82894/m.221504 type:complete len:216 (-) Transcript_82894:127-774(-)
MNVADDFLSAVIRTTSFDMCCDLELGLDRTVKPDPARMKERQQKTQSVLQSKRLERSLLGNADAAQDAGQAALMRELGYEEDEEGTEFVDSDRPGDVEEDGEEEATSFDVVFEENRPLGLDIKWGAVPPEIAGVIAGSPAALNGVRRGDRLVEVNGSTLDMDPRTSVRRMEDMMKELSSRPCSCTFLRAPGTSLHEAVAEMCRERGWATTLPESL